MSVVDPSPAATREIEELRTRLEEAEETLRAIRSGEVDGIVVSGPDGDQLYALEGAEHPYRLFFEAMNEGTLIVTADGLVLFCNPRFAEMLNLPVETIAAQNIEAIPDSE
ncbi:MAG: PAS domain-containing protein, partial [Thermoanaerobaculia bacterium]